MLQRLYIRDFVLVDRLELDFQSGFAVLTGETGAGKSILVDALALVLGERAESGVVRVGVEGPQKQAEIIAEFANDAAAQAWLEDAGMEGDAADAGESTLILRRVIDAGGRSRAWINGAPVTLTQLRGLAQRLVDIHGQHAHYALVDEARQRALIDAQAGQQDAVRQLGERWRVWQGHLEALRECERNTASSKQEREQLEWQIDELQSLDFKAADWQNLNVELSRLGHAADLLEGVNASLAAMDEGEQAAAQAMQLASSQLSRLSAIDAGLDEAAGLAESARIQIEETIHALRRYRDRLELNPQRLAEVEQRIAAVTDAARKHRIAPGAIPEHLTQLQQRFETLALQADPKRLQAEVDAAYAQYEKLAREIGKKRQQAANVLSAEVTAMMQQLGMSGGVFEVALTPCEAASFGLEEIEFRVSANAGREPAPLSRVASGGELSRIGLAIQVIGSRAGTAGTLVFDEVDVGIGGGVAEIVGRLLRQLGEERQILSVTHLPQVAACADQQWRVSKRQQGGVTLSQVDELDEMGRVEELARMLGGVKITETTRQHAAEMLAARHHALSA